jgi:hypothetical protein
MEYLETDAMFALGGLGLPFFRTGSRETCNPAPQDTDVDFVILNMQKFNPKSLGFDLTTDQEKGNDASYGDGDFETYRQGEVNLIVVHNWADFKAWKAATAAAKQMNITDKEKRIALFQGVLYGNW